MNTVVVPAGKFIHFPYRPPRNGVVRISMESDVPISTFILNLDGLVVLRSGKMPQARTYVPPLPEFDMRFDIPFSDQNWHLAFGNELANGKPARIKFTVMEL